MKILSLFAVLSLTSALAGQPLHAPSLQAVNTAYDELNPVISPDGKTLYVTIANHPLNTGGKKDPGDIWISVLGDDNQWSTPSHGGPALNNSTYNAVAGFSPDGASVFLLSHYDAENGPARTQGIAVATRNGMGWSKPVNITIPYFQNKSSLATGYILPDQSAFVFSAETYGTKGVDDIYITLRNTDGKWSEPKNLGITINTQFQELSPALSADGKTLYFSSNGRKGKGSFDVYSSTRLDDSWTNWSEPTAIEGPINSEGRDLFYRPYADQRFSLYTSTINSDGYGDVKFHGQQDIVAPGDSTTIATVDTKPVMPDPTDRLFRVYGKVTNAKTGEAIAAKVYFEAPPENQAVAASPAFGYSLNLVASEKYTIRIEASGYVSVLESLSNPDREMKTLEMNFTLQPVEIGTTVNLKSVLFEQGKTMLLPESYPELDLVANFLRANPNVRIELAGHTDNRGIPGQNVKLSQARVDRVKTYLISKGIDRRRISGKGFGGSKPIASNETEETRQLNRRVEFIIKKF
jgi:outer membrane protein OmpA-like peptidoglycan-associated protein